MVEEKELYCGTSSKNYIAAYSSSSLHALTGFDLVPNPFQVLHMNLEKKSLLREMMMG